MNPLNIAALLLIATQLLILPACSGSTEPQGVQTDVTAVQEHEGARAQPKDVASLPSASDPLKLLTVTPGLIDRCTPGGEKVSLDVAWNMGALQVEGVRLFWENPGEDPKLWTGGGPVGSERSGAWADVGTMVKAVNAADGSIIAEVTIRPAPCA